MPTLDTLKRNDMLSVLNQLTQKLYAIKSAKASKGYVESLCREQQEKYKKSIRLVKILIFLFWFLFLQYPLYGIRLGLAGLYIEHSEGNELLLPGLIFAISTALSVFFLIVTIVVYKSVVKRKQKVLSNYLNAVQPYIPFFDRIMQEEANNCYAFCAKYGISKELQDYDTARFVYSELSVSAQIPLHIAIENYRNHKHRIEMEAYAAEQNILLQKKIEQDKEYYQDIIREASESNEQLRRGNEQRKDIYNYIRYGY